MASTADIAHRWANQKFEKYGTLQGQSTHCDKDSFYSFNTVIAQWLDKKRKIMAVIDIPLSTKTARHLGDVLRAIPHDVTVFRFHRRARYWNGWSNVSTLRRDDSFVPMDLTEFFINNLYEVFLDAANCNAANPGNLHWWNELLRFGELFPAGSVKAYLRRKMPPTGEKRERKVRKTLRALMSGETFEEVVDVVNGKGTWEAYLQRTKGVRTAARNRELANKIDRYISPKYEHTGLSVKQLISLTPRDRVNLKLAKLIEKDNKVPEDKRLKSLNNLLKFLGMEPVLYGSDYTLGESSRKIQDPVSGVVLYSRRWANWYWQIGLPCVSFGLSSLAKAKKDPVRFRKWFFKKAREIGDIRLGAELDIKPGAESDANEHQLKCIQKFREFRAKREERNIKRNERLQDQLSREAAERFEREHLRQEKENAYKARGIDGLRDLWREGMYRSVKTEGYDQSEFYYGGNVLVRYDESKQIVETSKSIDLTVKQAKALWRAVSIWHQHPEKFKRIEIATKGTTYTAHSYENDILTAGCHQIAYCEMERMARQLNFIQ